MKYKYNKNMLFVIPEMPSKTFVMVLKKLPDHFKEGGSGSPYSNNKNVLLKVSRKFFFKP